ncbi:MAG: GIY-YIG nuclease family protein [Ruminococcaceae bacterium]|nr:GIY-YIG nuclease family protein [Oscillospiraceae bacterium]
MYYVYMMTNWTNNVLYIGVTNDLIRRTFEHKTKTVPGFTQRYNLNKLVYFEDFTNINQAIDREKQLKGWKRERKNQLINDFNKDWLDLSGMLG